MLAAIVVTGNHYYFDALVAVGVVCVALIAYNLWGRLIVKFRNNAPNHMQAAVTGTFAHSIDNDMAKKWGYVSVASLDVAFCVDRANRAFCI